MLHGPKDNVYIVASESEDVDDDILIHQYNQRIFQCLLSLGKGVKTIIVEENPLPAT